MHTFFSRMCFLLIIGLWIIPARAQTAADSDPAAKKILNQLRSEYDTYTSLEIDFNLTLDLPEQAPEKQKGKVIQAGEKYVVDLDAQAIYCDGKTVWVHLKDNNEVQINDLEETEDDSFLTPQDMLDIHESEDFYYAITNSYNKEGKQIKEIEFKPLQPDSEYIKMRLTVNATDNKMVDMEIFSRDGGKYILSINNITPNKSYALEQFKFPTEKFPGIHIEDLRF